MKSITRMKAGVISRLASYLQFVTNSKLPTLVANTRPVGGLNVSQTTQGVFYPTVQGAIDDLTGRCDLPINSIIMNTDGITPGFKLQSDQIKFEGTVTSDVGVAGDDIIIHVFGYPLTVLIGDTAEQVAAKAQALINTLVLKNECFTSCDINTSDASVLNITYNDYQSHVIESKTELGITISQTIVSPSKPGYGVWNQQGTADIVLTGGSVNGTLTVYYFKRVS